MPESETPRTVAYTPHAFTVNGQREILQIAALRFSPVPREQWADRIAGAKRDGMNGVQISLLTESPTPDAASHLGVILDECGRQGMYAVIAWDDEQAGPKTPIAVIAECQWHRGGPVILITIGDNENSQTRRAVLIRQNITVPIIAGLPKAATEYTQWQVWATGGIGYVVPVSYLFPLPSSLRRVTLWASTFAEILRTGTHRSDVPARGGLRVTETSTRERGSIIFVENPDEEKTVTGSVFPYLPEITLGPREIFAWVHDTPLGASPNYLAAYAGLVKSDARILTAHIRPDPFEGVRLYVYGNRGETREVVLFHGADRGQGVNVTFADTPQVYPVGPSQIVALSTEHAERTFFSPDDERAPVLIGPENVREQCGIDAVVELAPGKATALWSLNVEGELTEILVNAPAPLWTQPGCDDSAWSEIELPIIGKAAGGRYRATIYLDEETDATLRFESTPGPVTLWANGQWIGESADPEPEFALRLRSGENTLAADATEGIAGVVTLIPSGSCYLLDVAQWRWSGVRDEEGGGIWVGLAV